MGFDQYREPAGELSAETRTFARMIASLTEEAEARPRERLTRARAANWCSSAVSRWDHR